MVEFNINKGIGRPAEFKGLIAQYLFIFGGGMLAVFVVTVIIYMIGVPQMICVDFGLLSGSVLVWATFHLNGKYGQYGLMKVRP